MNSREFPGQPLGMETPEAPSYDIARWNELKNAGGLAFVVNSGRKLGVPDDEIENFVREELVRRNDPDFTFSFMTNMKMGTDENRRVAGERAYAFLMETGLPLRAADVAKKIWGEDSPQYRQAMELWKNPPKKTAAPKAPEKKQEVRITLSKEATFADLFKTLEAVKDEEINFDEELEGNFDPKILEEVLVLQNSPDLAASTKVVVFFKRHGYSQNEITNLLPISFRRQTKSK